MIKAIFFDMDGVLVDSEPLHFEAHKKALENFGVTLTLNDYMDFGVAKGDENLYEKAAQKYGVVIDEDKISEIKKQIYKEIFAHNGEIIDGVKETLAELFVKYDLAIVSSGAKDVVRYVLEKSELFEYFKFIVTGDDVKNVKPHPDVYLKAMELAGVNGDECVAIEDSQSGVEAAKNAGIRCIAIPNNFTKNQDLSLANQTVSSARELQKVILKF